MTLIAPHSARLLCARTSKEDMAAKLRADEPEAKRELLGAWAEVELSTPESG